MKKIWEPLQKMQLTACWIVQLMKVHWSNSLMMKFQTEYVTLTDVTRTICKYLLIRCFPQEMLDSGPGESVEGQGVVARDSRRRSVKIGFRLSCLDLAGWLTVAVKIHTGQRVFRWKKVRFINDTCTISHEALELLCTFKHGACKLCIVQYCHCLIQFLQQFDCSPTDILGWLVVTLPCPRLCTSQQIHLRCVSVLLRRRTKLRRKNPLWRTIPRPVF